MAIHQRIIVRLVVAAAIVGIATPAYAGLPDPVRAMIEAAITSGSKDKVEAVVEVAKATNPDDIAEIDQLNQSFLDRQVKLAAQKKAQEAEAIRHAGPFERWKGKGELGAFRSTGNGDDSGISGSVALKRSGFKWSHKITASADYQRSNGVTSRNRLFASYEPNFKFNRHLFIYGLGQFERDRIQGYSGRYSVSGGIGYQVIDGNDVELSFKAGPAYRFTRYEDGSYDSRLAGLLGLDFNWQITDRLKFTQGAKAVAEGGTSAVAVIDTRNTSINLVSGLEAKVSKRFSTRFSYTVDYDSTPPAGAVSTDTLSRFTVVYGF